MLYLKDPKTNRPSVSLTIVSISLIFLLFAGIMDLLGKSQGTSIALEFFLVACSLYWGRRLNVSKDGGIDVGDSTFNEKGS